MIVHPRSTDSEDRLVRLSTADPAARPDAGGAATIEREHQEQLSEPGDHERFSHYVKKDKIMESALEGGAVVALCGKVWVPSRDPQRFPVCPECKEIYEGFGGGDGDSGDGGSGGGRSGGFFGFGRGK
ncbi:MAG: DUF3039 domain-containing protein [Nesterenkonia sp.]|uniref:DUF3039 domain-containing protein n=1 Tax=Nesterenkonia marinintestina TaxID=2979865 RepID=UPI0021C10568|nr:DUF3039 domain-containing protein [Nesterenkonia sp. GX14115]MDO5491991.1 DUF3039 domain-containing protein [Nesterenkonia sp.]